MAVLREMMDETEIIGEVRGKGFMIAIGVLMLPCGRYNNVFRLMPPLVITKKHLDQALEIIRDVLK